MWFQALGKRYEKWFWNRLFGFRLNGTTGWAAGATGATPVGAGNPNFEKNPFELYSGLGLGLGGYDGATLGVGYAGYFLKERGSSWISWSLSGSDAGTWWNGCGTGDLKWKKCFVPFITVVAIRKLTSAVLWSKSSIFRGIYCSMKMPPCHWAPQAFIPHISTFKRGI